MKGIVFTELFEFVSERFGDDTVDDIIDASQLSGGGAYTAVGTYEHTEMVTLCSALATQTGVPTGELVRDFGGHLSSSFAKRHPRFFDRSKSFFDFLASVDDHIHVEVRKLYPDAELPTFKIEERTPTHMVMHYCSPRRMEILAMGLIEGSARQFGVAIRLGSESVPGSDGQATRFVIDLV